MLLLAPFEEVEREAARILTRVNGRLGHIFNLGHGILPQTDPEKLTALSAFVHAWQTSPD